jgi:hypothetical protein
MATSTLAPVTSFLPEDWTCRMARWITRWKPSVGWVSMSSSPETVGVCSLMKLAIRSLRSVIDVFAAAGAQGLGGRRVVEQRQQQVLDGNELVALLPRLDKGHVQADFEFLGNHQFSSMTQASGCWCWRANAHLFNLGGGDVARKDAAHASTFVVNFEHDSRRLFSVHAKKFLQHGDHELHRCVIVVQQHHLVHLRRHRSLAALCLKLTAFLRLRSHALRFYTVRSNPQHKIANGVESPEKAYDKQFPCLMYAALRH